MVKGSDIICYPLRHVDEHKYCVSILIICFKWIKLGNRLARTLSSGSDRQFYHCFSRHSRSLTAPTCMLSQKIIIFKGKNLHFRLKNLHFVLKNLHFYINTCNPLHLLTPSLPDFPAIPEFLADNRRNQGAEHFQPVTNCKFIIFNTKFIFSKNKFIRCHAKLPPRDEIRAACRRWRIKRSKPCLLRGMLYTIETHNYAENGEKWGKMGEMGNWITRYVYIFPGVGTNSTRSKPAIASMRRCSDGGTQPGQASFSSDFVQ